MIGCRGLTLTPSPAPSYPPPWTTTSLPSTPQPATVTPIIFPTYTVTSSPTETPSPTLTSTFTPISTATLEPTWPIQGPGEIIAPILLYHHIASSPSNNLYYVSPHEFEKQMYLLHEWGYKTISVEMLAKAINEGAPLPPKPIIITFDDGSETVYTTAFPIMQKYNFIGTIYVVHNYIGIPNYMNARQIRELYASGWEVGSHSLSHVNLTERVDRQRSEIVESRRKLQSLLGIPIQTFAYPFGAYNEDSVYYLRYAGYLAAVGLGEEFRQQRSNLYYLYRMTVGGDDDLWKFASRLPWQEQMDNLPILTSVP